MMTLHDRTWFNHILIRHPEMFQHRGLAEQAISNPLEIHISLSDADSRTYYGLGPRASIMIAVVGDVVKGLVKTAFLTNRTKGVREW